jgi:flagellar basal-body rod modification protein FlgD
MVSGVSSNTQTGNNTAATAPGGGSQVTKNMFLQLLVAQIKNQDPMSPSDGVQFLTQLAQFQQLEQSMNSGQDLSAIRTDLDQLAKAGITGTTGTTGTTQTSN